jgi:hypothetical protein
MPSQQRKIVYFLGAGASLGVGAYAPVQGKGRIPIHSGKPFYAFAEGERIGRKLNPFFLGIFSATDEFLGDSTPPSEARY